MLTGDRAARVQRAMLVEYLKTGRTASRLLSLGIGLLFWPWRTFSQALKLTKQDGQQLADVRSKPMQFLQQLWLAWFHGFSPQAYYQIGMSASRLPLRPMEWLQNGHAGLLSRVFREDKSLPEINDKLLFAQVMELNKVPTPSIIAVFENGQHVSGFSGVDLIGEVERHDSLFVKPARSSGGKDSILWERQRNGTWNYRVSSRSSTGFQQTLGRLDQEEFDNEKLLSLIVRLSMSGALLIQVCLKNHEIVSSLSQSTGLAAVRLLSGIFDNNVFPLRSVIYLPGRESITSQHGYPVSIEISSGCLGSLPFLLPTQSNLRDEPDTDQLVDNIRLPDWDQVLHLVERAHRALPDYPFLAWDIALTDSGPVMLEANGNYATDSLQKFGPRPLIDKEFLAVFDHWTQKPNYR